ncbi:MAG: tetratricopeptide repeat protein, partial [Flavobacteriales bacterium]
MKLQKGSGILRKPLWCALFIIPFLFPFLETFAQKGSRDSLVREWEEDRPEKAKERVKLLNELARNFYPVDPDSAEEYAKRAKKLSEKHDHNHGLEESLNLLGISYYVRSDHDKALKYWERLLKHRREREDAKGVADVQNNLGLLYKSLGNYK